MPPPCCRMHIRAAVVSDKSVEREVQSLAGRRKCMNRWNLEVDYIS
jgi:hypothetical protein